MLRIHHLNCASIQRLSILGQHLVCHCLLLETPDNGLVLVDAGLGTADYAAISSRLGFGFAHVYARPAVDPSLAAVNQIAGRGFDPADVRHIVMTHLDLDHVGGLSDFPQATVHVHAVELKAAMQRHGLRAKGRYRPAMWAHDPHFETYTEGGEEWFGFGAVRGLRDLPEQLLLVPLHGHTRGHAGVAIDTGDGWVLHAGDTYFDGRALRAGNRPAARRVRWFETVVTTDRGQRDDNQRRLGELIRDHPEVDVFCAHDPIEYGRHAGCPAHVDHLGQGS